MLWMFMLFASFLAAFRLAFSTKTHAILYQNALHFAAKRAPFCGKTHSV